MTRRGKGKAQNGAASASISTEARVNKDDEWFLLDDFIDEVNNDIFELLIEAKVKKITANIVKELEVFINVDAFMSWMLKHGDELGFDSKITINILTIIKKRVKANTAEANADDSADFAQPSNKRRMIQNSEQIDSHFVSEVASKLKDIFKQNHLSFITCTTQIKPQLYEQLRNSQELTTFSHDHFFHEDEINFKFRGANKTKMKEKWDRLVNERKNGQQKLENRDQHPIFEELFRDLTEKSQFDLYKEPWTFFADNKSRPDFVFITKSTPLRPYNCPFVVELQLGNIDNEHKCRVILYNRFILQSIPWRHYIISAVTDLDRLILFKTQRVLDPDTGADVFTSQETNEVDFWEKGIYILIHMINNSSQVGFNMSMNISGIVEGNICFISNFLGSGASADVFLFRPYDESQETFKQSRYAIKVFKKPEYYKRELETFLNIKSRFDEGKLPTQFIDIVDSFPKKNSIVYKPVGKKIHKLDKQIILEIFDAVKELHIRGIIHRDLSHNHFYKFDNHVLIIDFGSAYLVNGQVKSQPKEKKDTVNVLNTSSNNSDQFVFEGSIEFASEEILTHLANKTSKYTPRRRHDLESIVRSLIYLHYELKMPSMKKKDKEDTSYFANCVLKYWQVVDEFLSMVAGRFWTTALEIAKNQQENSYDDLRKHFSENFQKLSLDNGEITQKYFNKIKEIKRL